MLCPDDQGELSVQRACFAETPADAYRDLFRRLASSEAIAALRANAVPSGLTAEPRPLPNWESHAVILGLPTPNPEDETASETIQARHRADELLRVSAMVDTRKKGSDLQGLKRRLIRRGRVAPKPW